ncbi:hypothetical protein BJX61DRAFT_523703 [Aspergillus egyptiacus]|nr:hypothetical protein BJX61DRAFT_523703 [Aspergillus egyptiacus]
MLRCENQHEEAYGVLVWLASCVVARQCRANSDRHRATSMKIYLQSFSFLNSPLHSCPAFTRLQKNKNWFKRNKRSLSNTFSKLDSYFISRPPRSKPYSLKLSSMTSISACRAINH